jgi:RNA polymerase sigma-70 factor, ECF subfamily
MTDSSAKVVPLRGGRSRREGSLEARPDEELLGLASAGVVEAFASLVERYEVKVRSYCTRWCGATGVGEELAQEVFLDLWRARARYEPRGRFVAYLFALARNRCRTARRADRQELPASDSVELADPDQLDRILAKERRRRLDQRIADLRPKLREAVMLRYLGGLEYDEMARIVGSSENTVRSRVFLGLAELREWAREVEL